MTTEILFIRDAPGNRFSYLPPREYDALEPLEAETEKDDPFTLQ